MPKTADFCSHCGQKMAIHQLNFYSISHDFIHYFTHIERNIFFLIGKLSYQPGVVIKEYLHGKRKKYFPPVNFFLIVAGLLVVSVSVFNTFEIAFAKGSERHPLPANSPLLHLLNSKINWLLLLTMPLVALLYRIFFCREGQQFF